MITEFALAAVGTYLWNYLNSDAERKFKNNFKEIMLKTGIKNKDEETFRICKTIPTQYGFKCYINIPKGLSQEHLNSKINILQDNLNGIIELEKDKFKPKITMRIVNKDIDKFKFEPIKSYDNQLYIGKDFKGKNYLIDLNKDPHILLGGTTGTGKSFLMASILTNLIYNSSDFIELYLLQICKSEISIFEDCKCVQGVGLDENSCLYNLKYINSLLDKRANMFSTNGIKNITQWNKHFKAKRMKRIIVAIDEISFFMQYENLWDEVLKIVKAGRSVGIHIISAVQRSTATNITPDIKSQMTRITFRQKSTIDSVNIINTSDACTLKERECIIDGNNDYIMVKTPWIDEDYILLHEFVKEIRIPIEKEKQEVINIKKVNNKIYSIEKPLVIDVEENEITNLGAKGFIEPPKSKNKTGTISWEDFKNANKQG